MVERLSLDETLEQLKKWHEYGDKEALTLLVLSNQRLVKHFARKYGNEVISVEDLESISNEALIRAINSFDYINKPIQGFPSYIMTAIQHQISIEFRSNNKHRHVLSLNQPIHEDKDGETINLEGMIGFDLEEDLNRAMQASALEEALQHLNPKQRQILTLRYGLVDRQNRTFEEVGDILGCTRQAVSQQEKKALQKLRKPIYARKLGGFIID